MNMNSMRRTTGTLLAAPPPSPHTPPANPVTAVPTPGDEPYDDLPGLDTDSSDDDFDPTLPQPPTTPILTPQPGTVIYLTHIDDTITLDTSGAFLLGHL